MGKPCDKSPHHGYVQNGEVCGYCPPPKEGTGFVAIDGPDGRTYTMGVDLAEVPLRCGDAVACEGACVLEAGHVGSPNDGHQLADGRRYRWGQGAARNMLVWLAPADEPKKAVVPVFRPTDFLPTVFCEMVKIEATRMRRFSEFLRRTAGLSADEWPPPPSEEALTESIAKRLTGLQNQNDHFFSSRGYDTPFSWKGARIPFPAPSSREASPEARTPTGAARLTWLIITDGEVELAAMEEASRGGG